MRPGSVLMQLVSSSNMGHHSRKRRHSTSSKHWYVGIVPEKSAEQARVHKRLRLDDDHQTLKQAKRIKKMVADRLAAVARHDVDVNQGHRWIDHFEAFPHTSQSNDDVHMRGSRGHAKSAKNKRIEHHCPHCQCHLTPNGPSLNYTGSCAYAIRSLAAECARTEEELQLQLEALKSQLESKDKFRGKNLIPTVLHRLREYMEMTRKLHRRLLEADKETRQAGQEEAKLALLANRSAMAMRLGNEATDTLQNFTGGPSMSKLGSHGGGIGGEHHHEAMHKHDLIEAIADAAKKVMEALHSLMNNSDQKIRSAFDFEKTFNREILPSTFAYILPIKTLFDMCPKVLNEADTFHTSSKIGLPSLQVDDGLLPFQLAVPCDPGHLSGICPMQRLKQAADKFFSLLPLGSKKLPEAEKTVETSGIKYWPEGRIPFTMDENFNGKQRRKIWKAMDEYTKHTPVRFVPRIDDEDDYVYIRLGKEGELCSSNIGFVGGKQEVVLSEDCFHHGNILHELNHVLGFEHEHARPDRDKYIAINWDLVKDGCRENFSQSLSLEPLDYDYYSIMHYPADAFSKYGRQPTIVPKSSKVTMGDLGQRWNLSKMDVEKIKVIYGGVHQAERAETAGGQSA